LKNFDKIETNKAILCFALYVHWIGGGG